MTYVTSRMPTKRIRLNTMAKLFVTSVVILAGSPAVASQIARDDVHCRICGQKAGAFRHQPFGPCISPRSMRRIGTAGIKRTMIGRPICTWSNSRRQGDRISVGTFRTCRDRPVMSALWGKADIPPQGRDFRF
jgi:hypothetical protein